MHLKALTPNPPHVLSKHITQAMIGKDLNKAKALLTQGNIIALPTDTVYGLAAHAFCLPALHKLFTLKKRPLHKPLVLQIHHPDQLTHLVTQIPPKAQQLAHAFWPGPLTLVLQKKNTIPAILTAGKNTVGIRIPNHNMTLQLLSNLSFPLAVTSANLSGHPSPITANLVHKTLGPSIPYTLDGGKCKLGLESTLVAFENNKTMLYRTGYLTQQTLEKVIGPISTPPPNTLTSSSR